MSYFMHQILFTLSGRFVPTVRQLQSMLEAGYKFEPTVLVATSRKPRNTHGKELPDDLSDPENRGNYFLIRNPACTEEELIISGTGLA